MKTVLSCVLVFLFTATIAQNGRFVCPPCSSDCHNSEYKKPGSCTVCGKGLVTLEELNQGISYVNIFPDEVCELINKEKVLILDVRSDAEYDGRTSTLGKLKDAINIPIQELDERIADLERYRDQKIIVYCSISMRSPRASELLAENGFEVYNMLGGLTTWNSADEAELSCKTSLLEK